MDGSVSTLAPVFAAAFATHNSHAAFLVGLAASVGAGISMGFAEAASDVGSLTGCGIPLLRGVVSGLMTTAGGIGLTLPYLIPYFRTATAPPREQIRLLIADDHMLILEGLAATIGRQDDMTIVAKPSDGREAVELWKTHRPDVSLLDLRMPSLNGVGVIKELRDLDVS